jgi:putative transposase
MRKTFKYRIYPTKKQARLLEQQLEECRWLYNHWLEQKRDSYKETKKAPTLYQ